MGVAPVLKFHLYEKLLYPSELLVVSMNFATASFKQTSGNINPGLGSGFMVKEVSEKVSLTQPVCDSTNSFTCFFPEVEYSATWLALLV